MVCAFLHDPLQLCSLVDNCVYQAYIRVYTEETTFLSPLQVLWETRKMAVFLLQNPCPPLLYNSLYTGSQEEGHPLGPSRLSRCDLSHILWSLLTNLPCYLHPLPVKQDINPRAHCCSCVGHSIPICLRSPVQSLGMSWRAQAFQCVPVRLHFVTWLPLYR